VDRIDRSGSGFESLCDQNASANKPGAFAVDAGLNGVTASELADTPVDRTIALGAGAEIRYALGGNFRSLIGTLGVPAELLPYSPVRLVVLADGQEIYRSAWITSVDDPAPMAVSLVGKNQLTLKLETAGGPGQAIVADPLLVRK